MSKRIFITLLITTLTGCILGGCSKSKVSDSPNQETSNQTNDESNKSEKLEFAYITQDIANPYFIEVNAGFKDACEELGISTQVLDSKYDVASQRTYFEDSIERGVDGIMVSPLDENALIDVVTMAKEKGIVVSAEAHPVRTAQINAGLDEYNIGQSIGEAAAEWINDKLDGKGKVLLLAQDDIEDVIRRTDGIQDAILEKAPESVIIARQNASNTDLGMKVTESVLLAHPEVNVICTCDDFTAIGAYEAVNAMSDIAENFYIGGCDATEPGKEKMKEKDSVYRSSIDLFPYEAGQEIARAMYKYIKNEEKEDIVIERRYEPVWQKDVLALE